MPGRKILVVDDEDQIRALLRNLLEREGFVVFEASNSSDALDILARGAPSLVTLDINLAGEDGFALARDIRSRLDVPIIMISGKADEIDRIVGLELGADDYIVKPFNLREVLARIRAVLRRYEPRPATTRTVGKTVATFAGWSFDLDGREVRDPSGAEVDLTTAEFNLLAIFLDRPKRVLSRDQLLDLLKGAEWSPFDRSIDTLIARLRKKIESDPERPGLIKTVRGVGYVFSVDVTRD